MSTSPLCFGVRAGLAGVTLGVTVFEQGRLGVTEVEPGATFSLTGLPEKHIGYSEVIRMDGFNSDH